jgi:hypothetical protein
MIAAELQLGHVAEREPGAVEREDGTRSREAHGELDASVGAGHQQAIPLSVRTFGQGQYAAGSIAYLRRKALRLRVGRRVGFSQQFAKGTGINPHTGHSYQRNLESTSQAPGH